MCLSKLASANPIQLTAYNISNKCTCEWAIPPVCKPLSNGQKSIDAEFVNILSSGVVSPQTEIKSGQSGTVLSTIDPKYTSKNPEFAVRKSGSTGDYYSTDFMYMKGSKGVYAISINMPDNIGVVLVPMGSNWIDFNPVTNTGTCNYTGPNPTNDLFSKNKNK